MERYQDSLGKFYPSTCLVELLPDLEWKYPGTRRAALQALEVAMSTRRPFALILLGGQMSEMDGFHAGGRNKKKPPIGWPDARVKHGRYLSRWAWQLLVAT